MLRKRQQAQEEALSKARNEAVTRANIRQAAAQASRLPANTVVLIQAEDFSGQGGGTVSSVSNKTATVGAAVSQWNALGHWLEFTVEAPVEGYYCLGLVYCAEANTERVLQVDGEAQEPYAPLNLEATGGWSRGSDDWRLYVLPNPATDRPLLIRLKTGKNVLRLTNSIGGGANLDYLAIFSPDVQPTRESLAARFAR
jgi:hypothetical protein